MKIFKYNYNNQKILKKIYQKFNKMFKNKIKLILYNMNKILKIIQINKLNLHQKI